MTGAGDVNGKSRGERKGENALTGIRIAIRCRSLVPACREPEGHDAAALSHDTSHAVLHVTPRCAGAS